MNYIRLWYLGQSHVEHERKVTVQTEYLEPGFLYLL